eukprot:2114968-Lingulodinium_polyedra.AAC.1
MGCLARLVGLRLSLSLFWLWPRGPLALSARPLDLPLGPPGAFGPTGPTVTVDWLMSFSDWSLDRFPSPS